MLLAEAVLLLTTDDATGKRSGRYPDLLVGGALLADLMLAGLVRVSEVGEQVRANRAVTVPDAPWPTDPMLVDALTIAADKQHWTPQTLVSKLGHQRVNQVFERLATAEILSRQEHRVLGLIPTTRWITIDPEPERQLRARLDQVVLFGDESDPEVAALGGLLMAVRLLVPVVDQGRRVEARAVKQRGKELLQQYWPAVALQRAVQSREAANAAAASG